MATDPGARRAEGGKTRKGANAQRNAAVAADLILQQGLAGTTLEYVRGRGRAAPEPAATPA